MVDEIEFLFLTESNFRAHGKDKNANLADLLENFYYKLYRPTFLAI